MDFNYSLHNNMDRDMSFEIEDDNDDDDLFYEELRRQILILTAEDEDEDDLIESKYSNPVRVAKQGTNTAALALPGSYFNWPENENANSVPTWLLNLWRSGNGTGVFIPHIVKSRRRNRSRKKNNDRGRVYKATNKNI